MGTQVIYPGTFDPITNGHLALVARATVLFEKIVIAVNARPLKETLFTLEERLVLIEKNVDISKVKIIAFEGLLVEFAKQQGINLLLRGLRGTQDLDYEVQLATLNRQLNPAIETIFLLANEHNAFISSSSIKELVLLGGAVDNFVPANVTQALMEKYR